MMCTYFTFFSIYWSDTSLTLPEYPSFKAQPKPSPLQFVIKKVWMVNHIFTLVSNHIVKILHNISVSLRLYFRQYAHLQVFSKDWVLQMKVNSDCFAAEFICLNRENSYFIVFFLSMLALIRHNNNYLNSIQF